MPTILVLEDDAALRVLTASILHELGYDTLTAENAALRQQLIVLARRAPKRPRLTHTDRLIFVCLFRLCPSILEALVIPKPETVLRWHRAGLRAFWHWKSRSRGGRPRSRPKSVCAALALAEWPC